jgi:soluble lytic murein transglycosylase-like protein
MVARVVLAGCGMFRGDDSTDTTPVAASAPSSPSPSPSMYDVAPAPEPTRSPSSAPKSKKSKPVADPEPTEDPNHFTMPECADYDGKNVSKKAAKSALTVAAGRTYWPTSAPKLKLNADLVKAVAWQESGWQSAIVNCDGGRGLMQVMPETEDFVNQRFEKSYDAGDYKQNATVGATYLAWLTRYFGDNYFKKDYSLSPARCKTHESRCLLNMVIAGYNAGYGTVEEAYAEKRLPNPEYVNSVRHLMKSCYCDRY